MANEQAKFLCPRFDGEKYVETACLTCHDHGKVISRDKFIPCPDCGTFDATANMLAHSGIPEARRCQRFENFKMMAGVENAYKAVRLLTAEQQSLEAEKVIMVLLLGGTGNGKTHLAHASGIEAINQGDHVRFIRCKHMMREFKAAKSSNDEGQLKYERLFVEYSEVLYLIIDELDWDTDADTRMIEDLICERESNYLRTLITSNKDIMELEDTFPRMMSRFRDKRFGRIVLNQAGDYRRHKR